MAEKPKAEHNRSFRWGDESDDMRSSIEIYKKHDRSISDQVRVTEVVDNHHVLKIRLWQTKCAQVTTVPTTRNKGHMNGGCEKYMFAARWDVMRDTFHGVSAQPESDVKKATLPTRCTRKNTSAVRGIRANAMTAPPVFADLALPVTIPTPTLSGGMVVVQHRHPTSQNDKITLRRWVVWTVDVIEKRGPAAPTTLVRVFVSLSTTFPPPGILSRGQTHLLLLLLLLSCMFSYSPIRPGNDVLRRTPLTIDTYF